MPNIPVLDTDEYLAINPFMYNKSFHGHDSNLALQDISIPGSVLSFLQQLVIPNPRFGKELVTPCVTIARTQFSAHEGGIRTTTPSLFNTSHFQTLQWQKTGFRQYSAFDGNCSIQRHFLPSKSMIDLTRLRMVDVMHPNNEGNPHRPLEVVCPYDHSFYSESETVLVAHHYMGTREQWMSRQDARGIHVRMARYEYLQTRFGNEKNVDLLPWLQGFVENVGRTEALRLLDGVGRVATNTKDNNGRNNDSVAVDEPVYAIGDQVEVNLEGWGEWFCAEIVDSHPGGYHDVVYAEDCSEEIAVGPDRIRKIEGPSDQCVTQN